jgi:nucleoside-diphosphate-sugar epimerase
VSPTSTSVLVTGGAGFIGSHLVDGLLRDGRYKVRVLDNFVTGLRENLSHCLSDIELVEGDVRELETVDIAVEGVDCILHEAALPSVSRSVRAPITSNDVNVGGTLNLLSAGRRAGVKRFILASSSSVYGDGHELPKTEKMTPRPMSPYAVSKLAAEHYCRVFGDLYGIETIALRYFNVFGPRQDPRSQYSGVISKFITDTLTGQAYTVHGDGNQSRDFTFVDNVVAANLAAVECGRPSGDPINVACGERRTLLDVIDVLREISGTNNPISRVEARAGDVRDSQAGVERASAVLGYRPTVQFREGMRITYQWYANAPSKTSG